MRKARPRRRIHPGIWMVFSTCIMACQVATTVDPGSLTVLRIGVLPDRDHAGCAARYAGLVEYLGEEMDVEVTFTIASSYVDLVDRFGADDFDLALFGANTFAIARQRYGAEPLVLRNVDLQFTSIFIVSPEIAADSLEALAGADFAFGPRLSTSGHVMPRKHLLDRGLNPERLFGTIRYTRSHSETIALVREGNVAAGVVNAHLIREMMSDGRLESGDLRFIAETQPYADSLWAVPPRLPPTMRARLREAFFSLSPGEPRHREILHELGATYYRPANHGHFDPTATIIPQQSDGEGA